VGRGVFSYARTIRDNVHVRQGSCYDPSRLLARPSARNFDRESVTRMPTTVFDEGPTDSGPRLFYFFSLCVLLALPMDHKNHPNPLPIVNIDVFRVSPSTFKATHIYLYIVVIQCSEYEFCVCVCVFDVRIHEGNCNDNDVDDDDDNDGWHQFRIPTTTIYFGAEYTDNSHK